MVLLRQTVRGPSKDHAVTVLVSATTRPRSSWALGRTPLCRTQLATYRGASKPGVKSDFDAYSCISSLVGRILVVACCARSGVVRSQLARRDSARNASDALHRGADRDNGGFWMGYIWWLDVTAADLVTSRWIWGPDRRAPRRCRPKRPVRRLGTPVASNTDTSCAPGSVTSLRAEEPPVEGSGPRRSNENAQKLATVTPDVVHAA